MFEKYESETTTYYKRALWIFKAYASCIKYWQILKLP